MSFALTWTATGITASTAGTLSALQLTPTVVLLLIGGTIGDRFGQRQVLLVTTVIQVAQYVGMWAALGTQLDLVVILLANALVIGVVQGVAAPSTMVIARQFVAAEHVRAAISVSSVVTSLVRMVAPGVGAVALAAVGLRGSALIQVVCFAGVLAVLVMVRPINVPLRAPGAEVRRDVLAGVRSVWADQQARALLSAIAFVAGSMLPMAGLGFPLVARANGWGMGAAGLLTGAWTAGSVVASAAIAARYARTPTARPVGVVIGPLTAAATVVLVTIAENLWVAVTLCAVMGMGTALFTANVAPILVALAPAEQQSRWAAATTLAQFLPVLVVNPVLGTTADHLGLTPTLLAVAVVALFGAGAAHLAAPDGAGGWHLFHPR